MSRYTEGFALEVLARTIWGEARGDGRPGMEAVALVILNRARHPGWWGDEPASVCLDPYQFSCWLPDDPNAKKLIFVGLSDPAFATALTIAHSALAGTLADPTGGADSYYDRSMHTPPAWAATAHFCCEIGSQRFYKVQA